MLAEGWTCCKRLHVIDLMLTRSVVVVMMSGTLERELAL